MAPVSSRMVAQRFFSVSDSSDWLFTTVILLGWPSAQAARQGCQLWCQHHWRVANVRPDPVPGYPATPTWK